MVQEATEDDGMFEIATVPPPPGELDVYSAVTRLESTPLHLMASSMFTDEDVAADNVAATEDSVLLAIEALDAAPSSIESPSEGPSSATSSAIEASRADVVSATFGDRFVVVADLATLAAFAVLVAFSFFV